MPAHTLKLLVVLSFAWSVLCDDTPSGIGCVDPQGLVDCYNDNLNEANSCGESAVNTCISEDLDPCFEACGTVQLAANIGCWYESCWNQATVIQYLDVTDELVTPGPIPFYPPPADAPGACSCNLATVFEIISNGVDFGDCSPSLVSNFTLFDECQCCTYAAPISRIINTCPAANLSVLQVPDLIETYAQTIQEIGFTSDSCQSALGPNNICESAFNISSGDGPFVNPVAPPLGVPGTQPLSTLGGSVTSLPGSKTITLELFPAFTSTITMASFDARQVAQTDAPRVNGAPGGGSSGAGLFAALAMLAVGRVLWVI